MLTDEMLAAVRWVASRPPTAVEILGRGILSPLKLKSLVLPDPSYPYRTPAEMPGRLQNRGLPASGGHRRNSFGIIWSEHRVAEENHLLV